MSLVTKSVEEYNALFGTDEDAVSFVRRNVEVDPNALDEFLKLEEAKGLNPMQIAYVKELITFIFQNGRFEKTDLLKEELNFGDLFDNLQITALIEDIEEVMRITMHLE